LRCCAPTAVTRRKNFLTLINFLIALACEIRLPAPGAFWY
jgi:hypothetical protein